MNKKELFKELTSWYMPKCFYCKPFGLAVYKIRYYSKLIPERVSYCCSNHIIEATKELTQKVLDINSINIEHIVIHDMFKTILYLNQIDDIADDALRDLSNFLPKCKCGNLAIYQSYIPCALDSEEYLCKKCGEVILEKENSRYRLRDLDKRLFIEEYDKFITNDATKFLSSLY